MAKGLWIKRDQDRRPTLRRTPCEASLLRVTLKAEGVTGMACTNDTYSGDQPKILDWNCLLSRLMVSRL